VENRALEVGLAFVDAINRHDVEALVTLMSEDHCFVDGLGQFVRGREQMKNGWIGYFGWFPDYSIRVDHSLSKDNFVALFGSAQGTYSVNSELLPKNHWEIPAAWKVVVRGGRISEWRVYADNEPVWKIMGVKRY
jgi:SnoaL-like domain